MAINPDRRIKLTTTQQTIYTGLASMSYRLTVTTSNANLMPNEIFRYVRIGPGVGYPEAIDKYLGICTPVELLNLPINDPDPDLEPIMYFRKATIDITLTSFIQANEFIEDVTTAIIELKTSLDFNDGQTSSTPIWIGEAP